MEHIRKNGLTVVLIMSRRFLFKIEFECNIEFECKIEIEGPLKLTGTHEH
jgi:hypothetical protein